MRTPLILCLALAACSHGPHRYGGTLEASVEASGATVYPTGYVGTLAQAQAWQAAVDSAMGYPIAGTPVGGGPHVAGAGIAHESRILQGSVTGQWAYPIYPADTVSVAILENDSTELQLPVATQLDATWYEFGDAGESDAATIDAGVDAADAGLVDTGVMTDAALGGLDSAIHGVSVQ
jgi:hypothetical protein